MRDPCGKHFHMRPICPDNLGQLLVGQDQSTQLREAIQLSE